MIVKRPVTSQGAVNALQVLRSRVNRNLGKDTFRESLSLTGFEQSHC